MSSRARKKPAILPDSRGRSSTPISQARTSVPISPASSFTPAVQSQQSLNSIQTEGTEIEQVNRFLRIILGSAFQRWNSKQRQQQQDFLMSLTPDRIEVLSKDFAGQIVPTVDSKVKDELSLFASDLVECITKCNSARKTAAMIMNTLNACLNICIEGECFNILRNISSIILVFTEKFDETAYRLHKDFTLNAVSTLHKLAQALDLYYFCSAPYMKAIQETPNLANKSFLELKDICNKYDVTTQELFEDLNKKRCPIFADETVSTIIKVFIYIANENDDTSLIMLINQEGFIRLLSPETPVSILKECITLIQLIDMSKRKNLVVPLVDHLVNLASAIQSSSTVEQLYSIQRMTFGCLHRMVMIGIELENSALEKLVLIAGKIMDYLDIRTDISLLKEADHILHFIFKTLYMTIVRHPEVIGKNKKYKHKEFEPFVIKAGEIIDDKYFAYIAYKNLKDKLANISR
ncbi:unnamed protein product [Rhizopus stolonifer]